MGIIQVRTPDQGVVKVRIAGDEPTTEELQNIKMQFVNEDCNRQLSDLIDLCDNPDKEGDWDNFCKEIEMRDNAESKAQHDDNAESEINEFSTGQKMIDEFQRVITGLVEKKDARTMEWL